MWGAFIAIFAGIWLLQIILTQVQVKHYRDTIKRMSKRASGYLGAGVEKRKLGVGKVVIIVCDEDGTIVDSQLMSGVTVFARFKTFNEIIGESIYHLQDKAELEDLQVPISMAIKNIEGQLNKNTT
ncbi:transcriptional regulator GutM [Aquibacillus sp. 3ASR75-11]|uniref:Transcriptional regulator GutM n=1 Tax=Terrihalobacillus insolitus TaxID=2950438 RepID=A0A9X4ALN0_9BACI|nr:transcriptional regulator GutM [Terrihalobacillus insolitus]MDC3424567.1 transcriptional regulator GutM [Terrihalobacillus insolitus]